MSHAMSGLLRVVLTTASSLAMDSCVYLGDQLGVIDHSHYF